MKKLQVLKDNKWQYVFCYNELRGIITTENYKKALGARDLGHFQNRFANDQFRLSDDLIKSQTLSL